MREHRLGDVPRRHAGEAADLADAPEVGGFLEQVLRVDLRVGPVAADLLGVVGDAFDLVFGAGTQEHGAEFVAAGEPAEFGEHLRLARAFAREVEEAAGPAAAEQAEAVTQGRGGLAETGRRDEQAGRRVEAGLVEVGAALEPFRPRFLERQAVGQVEEAGVAGAAVLGVRREGLRLGEQVGLGGAGQGDGLARAVGGIDEDQLALHLARAGTEAGGVAVGGELEEVVGEAAEEELRLARQLEADRLDLADAHLGLRLPPLVGASGDGDRPAQRADLAGDGAFELPTPALGFGDLAHRLVPLAARFGAPRGAAGARARSGAERRELLRAQFDALRLEVDAHQGRTKWASPAAQRSRSVLRAATVSSSVVCASSGWPRIAAAPA